MKITITMDCPGIDHNSIKGTVLFNAIEEAWDKGYDCLVDEAQRNDQVSPLMDVSSWMFTKEADKTPADQRVALIPEGVDVLELKRLLMRLWINSPIILHGLLLFREAASTETTGFVVKEVRNETIALRKIVGEVLELPFDD